MLIKVGITGHTGSLGREIIKSKSGYKFYFFKGDVRNKKKISEWIKDKKFNAIIHLAAIVPIKVVNSNKKKAYNVNYIATKHIVDEVKKNKIEWFFFSSTSHVYSSKQRNISEKTKTKPISYYGKTKLLAEKYIIKILKNSDSRYCIGRIFSTTNKNQKENYLVPDLKKKIKQSKKKITLYNLNHHRDFISMIDISKIIFCLYKAKFKGIINIATGRATYLKDIAIHICKHYKKKIEFKDNVKKTYLVANINKLKKIYKKNLAKSLDEMIF
jgi:nucleoside-diphosphate-sugar epimerase